MAEQIKKRNIKKWLERSFDLRGKNIHEAKTALIDSILKNRLKIKKQVHLDDSFKVEAMYGSKIVSLLVGLIPFGKHLPSGKRFLLEASLFAGSDLHLDIRITPYMELFGTEEIPVITQSLDEKASDEYFAAKLLNQIVRGSFNRLNIPLPEDISIFNTSEFAKDTFWGILIYPLDSYRAKKTLFITTEPGPWCWGGFIIPEIWFLWNEIWGVSILAAIPTALYFTTEGSGSLRYILLALIIGLRVLLGLKGNKIYFAKYGRWSRAK